jgi:plastocyanin
MPRLAKVAAEARPAARRRWLAGVGASVVSCLVAGGAAGEPATHTVVIDGMQFRPAALRVQRGDRIVWVNRDLVPHTATSAHFDSDTIAPGARWTHVAARTGTAPYVCRLHPTMSGSLNVE